MNIENIITVINLIKELSKSGLLKSKKAKDFDDKKKEFDRLANILRQPNEELRTLESRYENGMYYIVCLKFNKNRTKATLKLIKKSNNKELYIYKYNIL